MGTLKDRIREIEKDEITAALIECNWIMAQAARRLGITERMIGYKIKKYGIRKEGAGEIADLSATKESMEHRRSA
ncbi:MAG: hypothetical protein EPN22_01770 [Nitrospirae bacterium]|nr:MAG: hypothetical protein EPN22_01770 [Nitrospirota bacterium]